MRTVRFATFAAIALVLVLAVPASASAPRSGTLHVTKECSGYSGLPGSFCTITTSNLNAIPVGSKIVYADPDPGFSTDLTMYTRGNNAAFGHVELVPPDGVIGTVTFSGGTGQFKKFTANLVVVWTGGLNYRWDGEYSY